MTRGTATTTTIYGEDEEGLDGGFGSGAHDDYADYELNDLIDDEITLGWWTRPDGKGGEVISLPVSDESSASPRRTRI